jgi:Ca2+-binding EF-hand superfamily protein
VLKYINKFINIYEDDLEEFYDMFKTFDEKGFIDISELENKSLKKCLKKLFKHLPLKKEKTEYRKES